MVLEEVCFRLIKYGDVLTKSCGRRDKGELYGHGSLIIDKVTDEAL